MIASGVPVITGAMVSLTKTFLLIESPRQFNTAGPTGRKVKITTRLVGQLNPKLVFTAFGPYVTLDAIPSVAPVALSRATQLNVPPTLLVSDTLNVILVPGQILPV